MNRHICIIDDDEDIRTVMCFALEFEGIKTFSFSNAIEAIAGLSKLDPADYPMLIVLDYMMPEMDGVEFIQYVRKQHSETIAKIPMVLSTARVELDCLTPEGIELLAKPLDLLDFLKVVKKYSDSSSAPALSL